MHPQLAPSFEVECSMLRSLWIGGFATLSVFLLFNRDPVVLTVGSTPITQNDIQLRDQIVHVFYPQDHTQNVGYLQLKKIYLLREILQNNGTNFTEVNLASEQNRIESSTKDRESLEKIKSLFKNKFGAFDEKRYQKVFILPTLVERVFNQNFFERLPIQEESHQKALHIHDEISLNPTRWREIASREKLQEGTLELSSQGISLKFDGKSKTDKELGQDLGGPEIRDESPEKNSNQKLKEKIQNQIENTRTQELERWFHDIVGPTLIGHLVEPVVAYDGHWLILRLTSKTKSQAQFKTLMINQVDFNQWFETEKAKILIK